MFGHLSLKQIQTLAYSAIVNHKLTFNFSLKWISLFCRDYDIDFGHAVLNQVSVGLLKLISSSLSLRHSKLECLFMDSIL